MEDFDDDVRESLKVIKSGGIILYPTDTVWGLGCDSGNKEAVDKIFKLKQREDSKSMIVLVHHDGMIERYFSEVPEVAWDLFEMSSKPTTIILDRASGVTEKLVAEDGSMGVRITTDPFCKKLIHQLNRPLVSTSANISGEPTPGHFGEISQAILDGVDYVVKHRQKERKPAKPSVIMKVSAGGKFSFIRK